ncbi:MAG TPA: sulfatase, partial [Polyangiaceae bacterium]|nr:sulfatase [Polyangiaceae bacterium]
GWRGVIGKEPPSALAVGVGLWVALSALLLIALAAVLKARTHHRGLGGATYGIFGAVALCAAAVMASRVVAFGRFLIERGVPRWLVRGAAWVLSASPLVLLAASALAGRGAADVAARAALLDLLLTAAVVALAYSREIPETLARRVRLAALPVAIALVAAGFARLELSHAGAAIKAGGGLPSAILHALEAWSDRDGDGAGAHFGGHDCDEGDPSRYPAAAEVSDDRFDSNCDGQDSPAPAAGPETTASASTPTMNARAPASEKAARPDIVLVTLDSVGASHCSGYGYQQKTTPELDKLAERGALFVHAYATGSDTQRATIPVVSGQTLSATPLSTLEWPYLEDNAETLAERLKKAGYGTGAVTSFTWLRKDLNFHQGFDHFDESPFRDQHPERSITGDTAIKSALSIYEKLAKAPEPLFLWLHLFDAHNDFIEHKGSSFGEGTRARYDGEIAFVDRHLGSLVKKVQGGARADRTLWLVHGTHGEAFGEHDDIGHGGSLVFDEVLRVPLVILAPGTKHTALRWGKDAVTTLDIVPTLLDYARASTKGTAGVSLRPAVEGVADFQRAPIFAHARSRAVVIDWPLKLIARDRKKGDDRLLLFDLDRDPGETKDISEERGPDLRRLDALR